MTTYTTIREAFTNGTGDSFFSYEETIILDVEQKLNNVQPQQPTIIERMKANAAKYNMVKSYASCDGYYDEFPDAYGQIL